jgi:transcription antitermination protein NusB
VALVKQKFREIVLQILFSSNFVICEDNYLVSLMMKQVKTTKKNILDSIEYVKKIIDNISLFDAQIKQASISYDFNRISKIELNILRLALYEMQNEKIPIEIVISEAIRLTKKFSSRHSTSFINAILDSIYRKKEYENITK